jgi:hypothetical protein
VHDQLSEPTRYASADEYEFMHEQVHIYLSKSIIRAWEDIKHKTSLIYENEVTFHIPYYTKLIQFQSVGLLQEGLYSPTPVQE